MSLYRNKYRVKSTRLKNWDYSRTGLYYVTICTYHHENFFGWIDENTEVNAVNLNALGKIADEKWKETKQIRGNVDLDEYVVMPNHFHGIVILENEEKEKMNLGKDPEFNKFGPQSNNLGSVIRGFKSSVTSAIHESGRPDFA